MFHQATKKIMENQPFIETILGDTVPPNMKDFNTHVAEEKRSQSRCSLGVSESNNTRSWKKR